VAPDDDSPEADPPISEEQAGDIARPLTPEELLVLERIRAEIRGLTHRPRPPLH
jgi:hypothetical protein